MMPHYTIQDRVMGSGITENKTQHQKQSYNIEVKALMKFLIPENSR